MATYYQRQRLPPPTESFLNELEATDINTPVRKAAPQSQASERKPQEQSFLIFPEPTAQIPAPIILNASTIIAVPSSSKPPASPLSRTDSSTSIPASLVASVARQSESREVTSVRSRSRDAVGSDWEELRGPLPKATASLRLRTRGRPGLSERPSFASTASRTPLTPLSENERGRLGRDLGWDWTLDKEESPSRDMLLSWQRLTADTASSNGEDQLESDGYSNYEDAASQLHDLVSYTNGSIADEEQSVTSELLRIRSPARRRRSIGSPEFRGGVRIERDAENRPRRYSFRLSSPSTRQQPKIPRSVAAPPRIASRTLPFGTFLQAIFSIDRETIELIDDPTSTAGPNIFGVRDAALPSELPTREELTSEHEAQQALRLLRSPENQELRTLRTDGIVVPTDKALLHAFRATQLLPTNAFALPFYLIGIGWEYGLKNMMALHRIILEEDTEA
ncbi:hypothetical protein M407DRAFT_219541 [Tulasnella calospora MUT 4182]|uniref:Uncharacterized protein n=1 Tax=Tulasnella calospora MUT 4182 TaxID=1051891 RepID=A0A0C3Q905_9AGAM|nr:hypothetical protein M407DRAFT_219541 [Tulasnella calospora MUT 4182]